MMLAVLLSPKTIGGFAIGALLAGAWAVLIHGPAQYEAGGLARTAELDAATNSAIQELSNEADRAAFLRRQCIERNGLYDFVTGSCVEGALE